MEKAVACFRHERNGGVVSNTPSGRRTQLVFPYQLVHGWERRGRNKNVLLWLHAGVNGFDQHFQGCIGSECSNHGGNQDAIVQKWFRLAENACSSTRHVKPFLPLFCVRVVLKRSSC